LATFRDEKGGQVMEPIWYLVVDSRWHNSQFPILTILVCEKAFVNDMDRLYGKYIDMLHIEDPHYGRSIMFFRRELDETDELMQKAYKSLLPEKS
jgi:hypothetical protein